MTKEQTKQLEIGKNAQKAVKQVSENEKLKKTGCGNRMAVQIT